ncbi:jg8404 [Pararge aegeria aegeria]|uniref:Jg8404 protein n=1 Tax=Pararge aegeria aegeria TaxID=348720 RepID=A0A8S4SL94_9NEOP|nr:jg8404 [Pararge aegeria aegeria]
MVPRHRGDFTLDKTDSRFTFTSRRPTGAHPAVVDSVLVKRVAINQQKLLPVYHYELVIDFWNKNHNQLFIVKPTYPEDVPMSDEVLREYIAEDIFGAE